MVENKILSVSLLVLGFFSLMGFLKPFNNALSVVWEIIFLLVSASLIFWSVPKKMFKLSLFYAINLIMIIVVNFYIKSNVSFAFFVISVILMSLGFVASINNISSYRKALPKKSVEELKDEIDKAFDNIAASNIELEKYYEQEALAEKKVKPKRKAAKKKKRK